MKTLVIGSGGREHALVWKIAQSPLVDEIFCAPGNAGMEQMATCVDIAADDINALVDLAKVKGIDLSIVGPEVPLTKGIVNTFEDQGLSIFGPSMEAARLEGSKAFSKQIMQELNIPTSSFGIFHDIKEARAFIAAAPFPLVVKADGLAAGKGVIVTKNKDEAYDAIEKIMGKKTFGSAGDTVVIEERLEGQEASFIAVCDGETIIPLASSQDHKRALDNDQGPNTGGMGAYSPAPVVDQGMHERIMNEVIRPLVLGMKKRNTPYRGIIYAGIMVTNKGPSVLEFNVRLGDPETQPLLMRLKSDIVPVMKAVADKKDISRIKLDWEKGPSVCVVLASGGYPGTYEKSLPISGIDRADNMGNIKVFHAGTASRDGRILTSGGRVLGVTAVGDDLESTLKRVYQAVETISFDGMFYRKDIAHRAIKGQI
ncbi:MAG: phosphoribosylamine--glycine ligase [Thermodesulfobacteriota bacterium]|nr:phosphoribosylamine--glycine ligase [Thermodesulfobacteriota bacterium]